VEQICTEDADEVMEGLGVGIFSAGKASGLAESA